MNKERKLPLKAKFTAIATLGTAAFLAACNGGNDKATELTIIPTTPSETPFPTRTIESIPPIPRPRMTVESIPSPSPEVRDTKEGIINLKDWQIGILGWEEKPDEEGYKKVEIQAVIKNNAVNVQDAISFVSDIPGRTSIRFQIKAGQYTYGGDIESAINPPYVTDIGYWQSPSTFIPEEFGVPVKLVFSKRLFAWCLWEIYRLHPWRSGN